MHALSDGVWLGGLHGLAFGGDYNPEQWPEAVWAEDARLMKEAGVNLVSMGIFAWSKLEPLPGQYDLNWLERVIDLLWRHGVRVCLSNATASPPPWLARLYPDSLPVNAEGQRLATGSRQHYCPNHQGYREAAARLTEVLAESFAGHPAVVLWHLNNELGCHLNTCYCEICSGAFRDWLGRRYGTLGALNEAWGTTFWSGVYTDWCEVDLPRKGPAMANPSQLLDYKRFMSESLRGVLANERAVLRRVAPEAQTVHNAVSLYRPVNYSNWFEDLDFAAWDSYPDPAGGLSEVQWTALTHDAFRSFKHGQPFFLMEQVTTQANWRPYNVLKAPGQMETGSWQAVARGADAVMFFQWRASLYGAEKFHGAMVPHFGPGGRVYRVVAALGAALSQVPDVVGSRLESKVALLLNWENIWALDGPGKPVALDGFEIAREFYAPFWNRQVTVDVVHPDRPLGDYSLVVAPALYLLTEHQALALKRYVLNGGTLVCTYFSGVVNDCDHVVSGGYSGYLQDLLGLVVEEWEPLRPSSLAEIHRKGQEPGQGRRFMEVVHAQGCEVEATFTNGYAAGKPAITRHRYGRGQAYYVATQPDENFLQTFFDSIRTELSIAGPIKGDIGVEGTVRRHQDGRAFLFVVNHLAKQASVDFGTEGGIDVLSGRVCRDLQSVEGYGVRVLRRAGNVT